MAEIPTPGEIRDQYIRSLRAEIPDLRTGEGSLAHAEATTVAALLSGLYARLDAIQRGITPATADTPETLAPHAETVRTPRKGATQARKASALEVRGTAGATVAEGLELRHSSGLRYRIATAAIVGPDGFVAADVESIDTGPATRLKAGEALTFTAPPAGITQTAKLVLDIDQGGLAAEQLGAWRDRVLAIWRTKRQGGNRTDYAQWALELIFVDQAYVYQNKPGLGHVAIAALKPGTGTVRILTDSERLQVAVYIDERRPICDQHHVIATVPRKIHGTVTVSIFPGNEPDWTGELTLSGPIVNRVATVNEPIPPDLDIGDYVTVVAIDPENDSGTGRPAIVSAVNGQDITLAPLAGDDPAGFATAAGDKLVPSSQCHYEIWQAITADLDRLGPANPGGTYGIWPSDITIGRIQAAALSHPAVRAAEVTLHGIPAGEDAIAVEFPWPRLDVELLIPGQWVVK